MEPRSPAQSAAPGDRPDGPSVAGSTQPELAHADRAGEAVPSPLEAWRPLERTLRPEGGSPSAGLGLSGDLFPGVASAPVRVSAPTETGARRVRPGEARYARRGDPAERARAARRWLLAKAKPAPESCPLLPDVPLPGRELVSEASMLPAPAGSAFARWRAARVEKALETQRSETWAQQPYTRREWREAVLTEQKADNASVEFTGGEPERPLSVAERAERHARALRLARAEDPKGQDTLCPLSAPRWRELEQCSAWVAVGLGGWRWAFSPSSGRAETEAYCRWHPSRSEADSVVALGAVALGAWRLAFGPSSDKASAKVFSRAQLKLWGAGGAAPRVSPAPAGAKRGRPTGSRAGAQARAKQPPSSGPSGREARAGELVNAKAFARKLRALAKVLKASEAARAAHVAEPGVPLKSRGLKVDFYPQTGPRTWRKPEGRPDAPFLILNKGATNCEVPPAVWRCKNGHSRLQPMGCARRRCENPGCKLHANAERVDRATAYLDAWNTPAQVVPLGVVVLPWAAELREAVRASAVLDAARSAALVLVEGAVLQDQGLDPRDGWRLGGYEATHPEGDERPGEWLPHFNLVFPLQAINRETGERQAFKRWKLRPATLVRLKRGWRQLQEAVKGAQLGRSPVAFYEWRSEPEKREHAKKYFFRTFPHWPAEAQRMRPWGYLGAAVVGELAEVAAMERRLAAEQERFEALQTAGKDCDNCGARMWLDTSGAPLGAKLCKEAPLLKGTGPPGPSG